MDYEFENICIDCKKRGYSVGFTFKSIKYKGIDLLEMPQKYMDGATIAFDYLEQEHIIHSIEKSVQKINEESSYKTDFAIIKMIQSNTRKKFTFFYNVLKIEDIYLPNMDNTNLKRLPLNGIYYLMDVLSESNTHIDIIITIINNTINPINNLDLYWFLDFDIYGNTYNKTNLFDLTLDSLSVGMYDSLDTSNSRIYAGLTTIETDFIIAKGAGYPNDFLPDFPERKPKFIESNQPSDYALGLQFSRKSINPIEDVIIPLSIVVGEGQMDFVENIKNAQQKLKILSELHKKMDFSDKRFIVDEKYSKINTAINKWCRDA